MRLPFAMQLPLTSCKTGESPSGIKRTHADADRLKYDTRYEAACETAQAALDAIARRNNEAPTYATKRAAIISSLANGYLRCQPRSNVSRRQKSKRRKMQRHGRATTGWVRGTQGSADTTCCSTRIRSPTRASRRRKSTESQLTVITRAPLLSRSEASY